MQGMNDTPLLKIRARPGSYACGIETIESILQGALNVLVEDGYRAFTLRRIAGECGMKVGNLTYYFPTKEMLVQELLEAILNGYQDLMDVVFAGANPRPEDRLATIITTILEDIRSKRTTNLFPELWALANHDAFVAARVEEFYAAAHARIAKAVSAVNPRLSDEDCLTVAMFISASMEGTTIFAGFGKSWEGRMPRIKALAVKSLVHLAQTVTPEEIRGLDNTKPGRPRGPAKAKAMASPDVATLSKADTAKPAIGKPRKADTPS
jgi:AcrR family transcriptional regulator